jgi:hypothetical protein
MVPRNDGGGSAYVPGSAEIDEALIVRKAIGNLFRHGDPSRLDLMEKKSLTSFSFCSNAFILPPAMSDQVLSCVVDPSTRSRSVVRFRRHDAARRALQTRPRSARPAPRCRRGLTRSQTVADAMRRRVWRKGLSAANGKRAAYCCIRRRVRGQCEGAAGIGASGKSSRSALRQRRARAHFVTSPVAMSIVAPCSQAQIVC